MKQRATRRCFVCGLRTNANGLMYFNHMRLHEKEGLLVRRVDVSDSGRHYTHFAMPVNKLLEWQVKYPKPLED